MKGFLALLRGSCAAQYAHNRIHEKLYTAHLISRRAGLAAALLAGKVREVLDASGDRFTAEQIARASSHTLGE